LAGTGPQTGMASQWARRGHPSAMSRCGAIRQTELSGYEERPYLNRIETEDWRLKTGD